MINERFDEDNIFFTSDTHFNDEYVLKLYNRPFKSVDEMNNTLTDNWNAVVPEDGIVFHLGDFGKGNKDYLSNVVDRLNGRIYLIEGDHDCMRTLDRISDSFEEIVLQKTIYVGEQKILLNHYPFLAYTGAHNDVWQVFGHAHLRPTAVMPTKYKMLFPTQYDVGVDNNNFTPVSFKQLKGIIHTQINNQKQ